MESSINILHKDSKKEWLSALEVFLWYWCNIKCVFCYQKNLRSIQPHYLNSSIVKDLIHSHRKRWKISIVFSWWEPLLDKNLLEYIQYASKEGYSDIRVHSNGTLLTSIEKFESYVQAGVTGFIFSIHWYWDIHDALTRSKWSFAKISRSIANFTKLKQKYPYLVLDTNTVLTKYNYQSLPILFRFLSYFPITRSQIIQLYSLWLFSQDEKKQLYITYEDSLESIYSILDNYKNQVTLENFPLCKINTTYHNFIVQRQKANNDSFWYIWEEIESIGTAYVEKCTHCEYKNECSGFPKDYIEIFWNSL